MSVPSFKRCPSHKVSSGMRSAMKCRVTLKVCGPQARREEIRMIIHLTQKTQFESLNYRDRA